MSKQTPLDFSRQLIKGKIAEHIFEQMFRRVEGYTVIPFGYEAVIPEIMQYTGKDVAVIENIRNAPDFALVSHDPKKVLLVEVKYRANLTAQEMRETAKRICEQWKLAWIFYATPHGFFFASCADLEKADKPTALSARIIPKEVQQEYLQLLKDFV